MPRRLFLPAALLALLAGCASGGSACGPREVMAANASSLPLEQLYVWAGGADWGANLLVHGNLPPGAAAPLRLPGAGPLALRAVWVDGRAAELPGIDGCTTRRVIIQDAALRAE